MDIESKCNIIEEFMRETTLHQAFEGDDVDQFIEFNDLGIPLAQAVSYGLATLTDEGQNLVEETWESLCSILDVDEEGEYEDLDDMFDEEDRS